MVLQVARVRPALFALSLAYFVMGTGSLSVIGLLPLMSMDLEVSNAAIARLIAIFALTFALAAPLIQRLVRRVSPRLLVQGIFVFSLGALASALAPNYDTVVAARVALAVGAAVIGPVASSLGAAIVPETERGRALAFVAAGMALATIVGVPGTSALGNIFGWRWGFGVLSGVGFIAALAVNILVRPATGASGFGSFKIGSVLQNPVARRLIVLNVFQMAAQFTTYSLAAAFLVEQFGLPSEKVPFTLLLFGIGGFAGTLVSGRLADWVGGLRTLLLALLSLAAMFLILLFLPRIGAAGICGLSILAFTALLFQAPQQKWLIQCVPQASGLALALNASAAYIGMAIGAATGSATYSLLGPGALPILSLTYLAPALMTLAGISGASNSAYWVTKR